MAALAAVLQEMQQGVLAILQAQAHRKVTMVVLETMAHQTVLVVAAHLEQVEILLEPLEMAAQVVLVLLIQLLVPL
jgi:hypothetical protein